MPPKPVKKPADITRQSMGMSKDAFSAMNQESIMNQRKDLDKVTKTGKDATKGNNATKGNK